MTHPHVSQETFDRGVGFFAGTAWKNPGFAFERQLTQLCLEAHMISILIAVEDLELTSWFNDLCGSEVDVPIGLESL